MQALFILSMGSALLWLPFAFSLFTAGLSGDIRLLAHSIEGQAGSPRISTVLNPENEGVKDFDVLISKAVIEQRLESYENALGFYVLAQRLQPDKPLIDINRGNILFTTKKFDPAINSYREALKKNPASFLPHYNLNIVYTDLFRFDEAKLSLEEAQNINLPLTQELTERTTGVVYQVPEKRILWKKVFAPSEYKTEQAVQLFGMLFKPAGLPQSPVIIAVFAAAIGIFRLVFNNRYISQPCGLCQKAICFHCQRRLFDLRVCRACWTNSRNIKRKADLRQLKSHRKKLRKFSGIASLILPGTGHFLYEKPFRALFILSLFLGLVFILFFPKWLLQPPGSSGGFSGIWLSPLVLASLIILYLLTWKDLNRLQV